MQTFKRLNRVVDRHDADQISTIPGQRTATLNRKGEVWIRCNSSAEAVLTDLPERVKQLALTRSYTAIVTESGWLWLSGYDILSPYFSEGDLLPVELPEPVRNVTLDYCDLAVVTESGKLWVCGNNLCGELGLGDTGFCAALRAVVLPAPVRKISVGEVQIAIIDESGAVWMCGNNADGQLGLGDTENRSVFTRVPVEEPMIDVVVTGFLSALLAERGQLWLAGQNGRARFTRVLEKRHVRQVSLDGWYVAAVTDNGELWLYDCSSTRKFGVTRVSDVGRVLRVSLGHEHTFSSEETSLRWVSREVNAYRDKLEPVNDCHEDVSVNELLAAWSCFYGQLLIVS